MGIMAVLGNTCSDRFVKKHLGKVLLQLHDIIEELEEEIND